MHASRACLQINNAPYGKQAAPYLPDMMHVQEGVVNAPVSHRIAASFVVPWSGFVAAFLYYALLAALLLGGVSPQAATVGLAYVAPVLAYAVWLASRMMALVTPHAVPRHAVGFAVAAPRA